MDRINLLSDEMVALRVQQGEVELYGELIERYQAKLLRYSNSLLRDDVLASGVVQDSFVKAYINIQSFSAKKKFSSWIYRIVRNETLNLLKKRGREESMPDDFDPVSTEDSPDIASHNEMKFMLEECLGKMPEKYAEPLILFYLEDKSYDEISDIMRLPVSTVGTRIRRAKTIMKNICLET